MCRFIEIDRLKFYWIVTVVVFYLVNFVINKKWKKKLNLILLRALSSISCKQHCDTCEIICMFTYDVKISTTVTLIVRCWEVDAVSSITLYGHGLCNIVRPINGNLKRSAVKHFYYRIYLEQLFSNVGVLIQIKYTLTLEFYSKRLIGFHVIFYSD